MNIRRKPRSRGGFSLPELLVCVLILALAGGLITQTLALGVGQFLTRTRESEARTLCNTLSLAMREQLTYVTEYHADGRFKSGAIPALSGLDCSFAIGGAGNSSSEYEERPDGGQILLKCGGKYYPLADFADYADYADYGDGNDLIADFEVTPVKKDDGKIDYFKVTVTVRAKEEPLQAGSGMEAASSFIVTPLRRDVVPG